MRGQLSRSKGSDAAFGAMAGSGGARLLSGARAGSSSGCRAAESVHAPFSESSDAPAADLTELDLRFERVERDAICATAVLRSRPPAVQDLARPKRGEEPLDLAPLCAREQGEKLVVGIPMT